MESKIEINLPLTLIVSRRNDINIITLPKKILVDRYNLKDGDILEIIILRIIKNGVKHD